MSNVTGKLCSMIERDMCQPYYSDVLERDMYRFEPPIGGRDIYKWEKPEGVITLVLRGNSLVVYANRFKVKSYLLTRRNRQVLLDDWRNIVKSAVKYCERLSG